MVKTMFQGLKRMLCKAREDNIKRKGVNLWLKQCFKV
jgi:hypothetical protein